MGDEIRELAEARLRAHEARKGPVANPERYIAAAMRGIESDRRAAPPAAPKQYRDERPDCPRCDGNGWVETVPEGGYQMVTRCPDCDRGRVNLRAAPEAPCSPDVARAHVAEIRAGVLRMRAKQSVRDL